MDIKQKDLGLSNVTIDQNNVYLTITIGDDQIGGSKIYWADNPAPLVKGKISHYLVGEKTTIIGKTLNIYTTLIDSGHEDIDIIIGLDGTDYTPTPTEDTFDGNEYYILKSQYKFN